MQFKNAGYDDLEILVESRMEVLKEVFQISDEKDLSALRTANLVYYEQSLISGEHIACLVFDRDSFVGCGGLCLQKEMPSPDNTNGKCGYLMNIYIRKEYRRRQIGKQVVQWLVERAKELDVSKLTLETTANGLPLYEHLGFEIITDYMKRNL